MHQSARKAAPRHDLTFVEVGLVLVVLVVAKWSAGSSPLHIIWCDTTLVQTLPESGS